MYSVNPRATTTTVPYPYPYPYPYQIPCTVIITNTDSASFAHNEYVFLITALWYGWSQVVSRVVRLRVHWRNTLQQLQEVGQVQSGESG